MTCPSQAAAGPTLQVEHAPAMLEHLDRSLSQTNLSNVLLTLNELDVACPLQGHAPATSKPVVFKTE